MMPVAIPGENANGNSHMHLKFESPEGKKVFVAGDLSKGETSPFGTMRRLGDQVQSTP